MKMRVVDMLVLVFRQIISNSDHDKLVKQEK